VTYTHRIVINNSDYVVGSRLLYEEIPSRYRWKNVLAANIVVGNVCMRKKKHPVSQSSIPGDRYDR